MKDHYVTYGQAVKLKELGLMLMTYTHYTKGDNTIRYSEEAINWNNGAELFSAPRLDQAAAWLREEKGWHIQVRINGVRSAYWYEIWSTTPNGPVYGTPDDETFRRGQHCTYEQALSAGIDKALELLTDKLKQ